MAGRSLQLLPGGDRNGVGDGSWPEASRGGVSPLAHPGEAGLGAGCLLGFIDHQCMSCRDGSHLHQLPVQHFPKMGSSGTNSAGSQHMLYGGNIPESNVFEKCSQSGIFFLSTGLLRT